MYPKGLKYNKNPKKLVAEKIKEETCGEPIYKTLQDENVEMYTFITENNHEAKK